MKIGEIDFGDNLFLAPMAGVTDVGFRDLSSFFGADATYSEMLSARAMLHNPKKTSLMTIYSPLEKVKIGQIFGHESEIMAKAVKSPLLKDYDVIDINMGCPAPKIVKNGEGSALLKDLTLASKIISSVVKASSRPVSVKFRIGFDKDISADIGRMCEESGASFVCVHGRTTQQGYSGKADLESIAKVKSVVNIPVIGNGDVVDEKSYKRMLETGVDGVMIGRGSLGKPFIFSQLKKANMNIDILWIIKRHIEILRKYFEEDWLVKYFRKHLLWYLPNIKGEERIKLATSPSLDLSLEIIEKYFAGV